MHMLEDSYFLNTFWQKEGQRRWSVSRTPSCSILCRPEALHDRNYILMPHNAITFPIMPCNQFVLLETCLWVWFLGLSEELMLLWVKNFSFQVFLFFLTKYIVSMSKYVTIFCQKTITKAGNSDIPSIYNMQVLLISTFSLKNILSEKF